jgi:GNAT superfamily N-acetyltransferase
MDDITIRPVVAEDQPFLEVMLYEALFIPPGMGPLPQSLVRSPAIARYVTGFGTREGDVGFVAMDGGAGALGAAWARRWDRDEPGYGFVDADTPEAAIAVVPGRRGEGIGSRLLAALVEAAPRLSLSVDDRSRAVPLYERFGFAVVDHEEHSS